MLKGDIVTIQPPYWYDETPVANWPDPQFVGRVIKVEHIWGVQYAKVLYPAGRMDYEVISDLHLVRR